MKRCVSCGSEIDGSSWHCTHCHFEPIRFQQWLSFVPNEISSGVEEFNDEVYIRIAPLEQRGFYYIARQALILWALRKYFPNLKRFYDFGSGTGGIFEAIMNDRPDVEMFGSDLASDSLRWTEKRLSRPATLFHTDADHIPYIGEFDAVGVFDVMEHIEDDLGALCLIQKAIKPGGGIILTVPQHMVFWSKLDDSAGHYRRYVGNELAEKVREAGFTVLLDTSFMASLFLPQYLARRLLAQRETTKFEAEHMLPRPINAILKFILFSELGLIQAGIRFPIGGTRLVVGILN